VKINLPKIPPPRNAVRALTPGVAVHFPVHLVKLISSCLPNILLAHSVVFDASSGVPDCPKVLHTDANDGHRMFSDGFCDSASRPPARFGVLHRN